MKKSTNILRIKLIISLVLFCSISFTSNCLFADDKFERIKEPISDTQSDRIHGSLKQIAIESMNAAEGNVDIILNDILKLITDVKVMETGFWTHDLNKIVKEIDNNVQDSRNVIKVLEKEIQRERKQG